MSKEIRIVYTPLHGTGNLPVRRVLKELGFANVYVVPEQELPNGALIETIVTTDMTKALAKEYGVKLIEVLTGFKYIGEQIKLFEQQQLYEYVFGLEESYGCLAGTYARHKDACVAVMVLCEAAS